MSPWVFSELDYKEGFVFGFSFQKIPGDVHKTLFLFQTPDS